MGKAGVTAYASVGCIFDDPVGNGGGGCVANLNIRRAAAGVLTVRGTTYASVVGGAAASAGDDDRLAEVGAHLLKYFQRLWVDGIEPTAAATGEFSALKVFAELGHGRASSSCWMRWSSALTLVRKVLNSRSASVLR